MNIRFLQETEIELIESLDDNGDIDSSSMETFAKGDTLEVDLIEESGGRTQFQTGDGNVFFIEDELFEEVE
jgi:hypothetical protein